MAYEYESKLKNRLLDLEFDTWEETAQFEREYRELERVYRKAKAFDNYMVDLVKSVETYPDINEQWVKESYDIYMQSREKFIETYKDEMLKGHEIIESVEEYDKIISDLERADDEN